MANRTLDIYDDSEIVTGPTAIFYKKYVIFQFTYKQIIKFKKQVEIVWYKTLIKGDKV